MIEISIEEKNNEISPTRLGNIYGEQFGTGYAGNVWDKDCISPTLRTMQGGCNHPLVISDGSPVKVGNVNPSNKGMNGDVYSDKGLCPTLTTNKGEGIKMVIQDESCCIDLPCIAASRGRNPENPSDRTIGIPTEQRLEVNKTGCSNTITSVQKDNYVLEDKVKISQATKKGYVECEVGGVADLSYPTSQTRRGRVQDGENISPTITATETGVHRIEPGIRIRKLTPKECWRLMGFSDEAFEAAESAGVSNTQLYKQAGNSIVVDVLFYIYKELYEAMPYLFDDLRLSSFFSGIGAFEIALDRLYESIQNQ